MYECVWDSGIWHWLKRTLTSLTGLGKSLLVRRPGIFILALVGEWAFLAYATMTKIQHQTKFLLFIILLDIPSRLDELHGASCHPKAQNPSPRSSPSSSQWRHRYTSGSTSAVNPGDLITLRDPEISHPAWQLADDILSSLSLMRYHTYVRPITLHYDSQQIGNIRLEFRPHLGSSVRHTRASWMRGEHSATWANAPHTIIQKRLFHGIHRQTQISADVIL